MTSVGRAEPNPPSEHGSEFENSDDAKMNPSGSTYPFTGQGFRRLEVQIPEPGAAPERPRLYVFSLRKVHLQHGLRIYSIRA